MKGTINNWSYIVDPRDIAKSAAQQRKRVFGRFVPEGMNKETDDIMTSSPVGKRGDVLVTASGSEYKLGTVDPAWEKKYPGSSKAFWDKLPELPARQ